MNTKSRNFKVAPEFEQLFSFSDTGEKLEHRAQMISFRILSEVEKVCEEQNIKMKDLAKMVNTSPSYITQLFRGNKQINTAFMARFEEAMNMIFAFSLCKEKEVQDDLSRIQMLENTLKRLRDSDPGRVYCYAVPGRGKDSTDELLKNLAEADNEVQPEKQTA
ncbi:MAG TPA: helix-turn-helix transcriptional regulator [Puia sp.]|uniref:helix-turn-helix domain-containing protein n=1 Tax=Puia sp. TaxID=2045100 RepID=UPI002CD54ADE|nr:helix-turn-helix transcriptional regulator [Puia sp.]HVU96905.1 helix-turn-helix transcriptional regulator [Puia sp.]